jgi:hypothetical protein
MVLSLLPDQPSRTASSVCRSRPRGRRLGCSLVAECVSAILAVSVALAYASPPDSSWISGIYDDHDYDDVVGMVTDGTGMSDSGAPPRFERVLIGFILRVGTAPIPHPTVGWRRTRGPPFETLDLDPLLISPPNASPLSNIRLIHPGCSGSRAVLVLLPPRGCTSCLWLDLACV